MCGCLPHAPIGPTTQARALTGNQTSNPLVHRPALNPLGHTSQGLMFFFSFHGKVETESSWNKKANEVKTKTSLIFPRQVTKPLGAPISSSI